MKNDKNSDIIEYMDRKTLEDLYSKTVEKYAEAFKALSEGNRKSPMDLKEINHEIDEARKGMVMKESHNEKK